MEIKNRQITQRFGYSHVPIGHTKFEEQLEPKIKDSVIMLISLGYITTSSCQGHKNAPFITLDKKTTNENMNSPFERVQARTNPRPWVALILRCLPFPTIILFTVPSVL